MFTFLRIFRIQRVQIVFIVSQLQRLKVFPYRSIKQPLCILDPQVSDVFFSLDESCQHIWPLSHTTGLLRTRGGVCVLVCVCTYVHMPRSLDGRIVEQMCQHASAQSW